MIVSVGVGVSVDKKSVTTITVSGNAGPVKSTTKVTAAASVDSKNKVSLEVGVQKEVSPKVKVSTSVGVSF